MENEYHNPDNIEAYLSGKLSPQEKGVFEQELAKDPLLKTELHLQRDIIESLKLSRVSALKQRLNNIEVGVGASPFSSLSFKIAASVLIPAAIGLGVYSFMGSSDSHKKAAPIVKAEKPEEIIYTTDHATTDNNRNQTDQSLLEQPSQNTIATAPEIGKDVAISLPSKPKNTTKATRILAPRLKEFSDPEFQGEVNLNVPQGDLVSGTDNISDLKVVVEPQGDKTFHYKFYSNKLFLYCDFQSKPYEILELNSSKKRRLYLFHNEVFYELKSNKKEFTPLTELKDPQLIKQLNTIKDK